MALRGRVTAGLCRILLALPLLAAPVTPAAGAASDDAWYSVLLQGRPVGWMHATQSRDADRIISEEALSITVRRGAEAIAVETSSRFAETPEGVALEAEDRQRLGAAEVVRTYRFGGPEVQVTVREGGRAQTRRVPAPEGAWLTPAAVERYVRAEVSAGAREIHYRAVTTEGELAVADVSMRPVDREPVEVLGKVVPGLVWDTATSLLPGVTARETTDEAGRSLRTTLDLLPGVSLTVVEADRELALAKVSPPEILASTLVAPEGRLLAPRALRRAVYEVRVAGVAAGSEPRLPETTSQRVEPVGAAAWRVTVDLDRPVGEGSPPGDDCRRPSSYVGSDDPEVVRLAARALGGQHPMPSEAAEALRRFVQGFVRKRDLSVGFATAGEVARTAQGDCTEHAVLLAALLRAEGIPSRVVSGLIYVDRFLGREAVFGYHLWTQAWVAGEGAPAHWVDLDATLDEHPFDAAHIALATSALAEGAFSNDLVRLAPLLGRLSVRIVEPGPAAAGPLSPLEGAGR